MFNSHILLSLIHRFTLQNFPSPRRQKIDEEDQRSSDLNLFGLEVISALQKTSSRTPSVKLKAVIQGVISTIHTGGNLGSFLQARFRTAMRLKRLNLKKYSDNLAVLFELYVAILLTGLLLLAIMVSAMSVMGGTPSACLRQTPP